MAPATDGRAQDQGRRHRAKGQPSPATSSLLARYQEAMRGELAGVLDELRGKAPKPGLMPDVPADPVRPALGDRIRLWDLAIKLGRELGTEVDPAGVGGAPGATPPARPRSRRRVDFGPDA